MFAKPAAGLIRLVVGERDHLGLLFGFLTGQHHRNRPSAPTTRQIDFLDCSPAVGTHAALRGSGTKCLFPGPRLPTLAAPQVGSYLGYTGRCAKLAAKSACDPEQA